jgi:hypothetical protein
MANTIIQIKRSSTTAKPVDGSLSAAELAYSYNSEKLFLGNPTGTGVIEIGGGYWTNLALYAATTANTGGGATAIGAAAFNTANAAFGQGNTTLSSLNSNWAVTNAAYTQGNTTLSSLNSNWAVTNAAYTQANSGVTIGTGAFNVLNVAYAAANSNAVSLSTNVAALAANVNTLAGAAYPKTGGTISGDVTVTGSLTVSGTTTYVNTQTLLVGDNIVTLNADLPGNVQPTENAGLEVNRGARTSNAAFIWNETANSWQFTSNTLAGVYSIVASQTDANNVGAAANNYAAATYLTQSAFNTANANAVSLSANVAVLAAAFVSNSQSLSANVNTLAAAFVSNTQSLSANVNTLAATFASANANNISLASNVAVLAAAASDAGFITSGTLGTARLSGSYTGITGVGTITAGTWNGSTVNVAYGGTGIVSATLNGVLFGRGGSGALQVTSAGTEGQVLQAGATGVPSFAMLDGGSF